MSLSSISLTFFFFLSERLDFVWSLSDTFHFIYLPVMHLCRCGSILLEALLPCLPNRLALSCASHLPLWFGWVIPLHLGSLPSPFHLFILSYDPSDVLSNMFNTETVQPIEPIPRTISGWLKLSVQCVHVGGITRERESSLIKRSCSCEWYSTALGEPLQRWRSRLREEEIVSTFLCENSRVWVSLLTLAG